MDFDLLKFLLFGVALGGSLLLGFWPGGVKGVKPLWWKLLASLSLLLLIWFGFSIPTGGTFGSASMVEVNRGPGAASPVHGTVTSAVGGTEREILLRDFAGKEHPVDVSGLESIGFERGEEVVLAIHRDTVTGGYRAEYLVSRSPFATLPMIPALEERARNIYFHVPSAWVSQLAWFVAVAFAIGYLRRGKPEHDVMAVSAAALGALFCVLATVTGSIWAKFNWGAFWNWDPRQVSIVVVLLIYGAFFALRSSIESREQRARVSAIYLLLLALPVVFFIFVFPRLMPGLHPGAEGDVNVGPVISPQEIWMDRVKQVLFALGFFSFTMMFFWLMNLAVRVRLLDLNLLRRRGRDTINDSEKTAIAPEPVRHS